MTDPSWHLDGDSMADSEREPSELGSEIASEVIDRYGSTAPREIAAAADIEVRVDEWDGMDGLVMLGTYGGRTITLYSSQIEAYARDRDIEQTYLTEAVVAHELGHHFLATADPSARPDGLLKRLLMRCRGSGRPKPVREAAANGFALELLERHRPDSPILTHPHLLADLADTGQ